MKTNRSILIQVAIVATTVIALAHLPASPVHAEGERTVLGGIDHVALTVSNVDASESFFAHHLGFELVKRDTDHPAIYMTNGTVSLTLYRIADLGHEVQFDRKRNVGLHHLALSIASFEELGPIAPPA